MATEATVIVKNQKGLHARSAAKLAAVSKKYRSTVYLCRHDDPDLDPEPCVPANDILELLTLGASQGTRMKIRAAGEDAESAMNAIIALFESGFGEGAEK